MYCRPRRDSRAACAYYPSCERVRLQERRKGVMLKLLWPWDLREDSPAVWGNVRKLVQCRGSALRSLSQYKATGESGISVAPFDGKPTKVVPLSVWHTRCATIRNHCRISFEPTVNNFCCPPVTRTFFQCLQTIYQSNFPLPVFLKMHANFFNHLKTDDLQCRL